jgi:hypothetical protein
MRELDTSLLDVGVKMDVDEVFKLAEEEYGCCFHGTCPKCKPFVSVWRKPHVPCVPICHPESLFPEDDEVAPSSVGIKPQVKTVRPKRVHGSKFIPDYDW